TQYALNYENPRAIRDAVNTAIPDPQQAKNVATVAQQMLRNGQDDAAVIAYLKGKGVDEAVATQAVAEARLPPPPQAGPRPRSPAQQATLVANRAKGSAYEPKAIQALVDRGETVINSQRPRGTYINEGFDSLSYTGTGRDAQLYINDAKNCTG